MTVFPSIYQNDELYRFSPNSPWIKTWDTWGKKIVLFKERDQLQAGFFTGSSFYKIQSEWIEGLPDRIRQEPERYRAFFDGTHARVIQLDQNEFKLVISPTLLGGMFGKKNDPQENEPKIQRLNPKVIKDIREGMRNYVQSAQGKSIFVLIGPTKHGKSTITNHLRGKELIAKKGDFGNVLDVSRGDSSPPIGERVAVSETKYARTYPIAGEKELCITDTAGLFESNKDMEIPNAICTKLTLQTAKDVKIGLCCELPSIISTAGKVFHESLEVIFENFLQSSKAQNSMMLIVTKADGVSKEAIVKQLKLNIEQLKQEGCYEDLVQKLNYLLRKNGEDGKEGDFIVVYDATKEACKKELLEVVKEGLAPIEDKTIFGNAYSAIANMQICQEILYLASIGKRLFEEFLSVERTKVEINSELNLVSKELEDLNGIKLKVEKDPIKAQAQLKDINQANQKQIDQLKEANKDLNGQIVKLMSRKAVCEQEFNKLKQKDNELFCCWSKSRNIRGAGEYRFEHSSPFPIADIKITPDSVRQHFSKYELVKERKSFLAVLKMPKKSGIPTVKIELMQLNKYDPEVIRLKEELNEEMKANDKSRAGLLEKIEANELEIKKLSDAIAQGQVVIEKQGVEKEVVGYFDVQIKAKTEAIEKLKTRLAQLNKESETKRAEIDPKLDKDSGEFSFMCEYLLLSQDELSKKPVVREFMDLKEKYEKKIEELKAEKK